MMSSVFRRGVHLMLVGVVTVCLVSVVLPLLSDLYWALELPGHFRPQLAVMAVSATLGFAVLRTWRSAVAGLIVSAIIAGPVVALWIPQSTTTEDISTIDLMSLNVSFYGRNHETVRELITRIEPHIIGLVEVDDEWMADLGALDDAYPYRLVEPPGRRAGTALLSKLPLAAPQVRPLERTWILAADVQLGDRPVRVAVVHFASPLWGSRAALRNQQMRALADYGERQSDRDFILIGDFNTTPWSLAFRRLIRRTGLRNAAGGFGLSPTWPVRWPLLRIPIDHCLVSDGITVQQFAAVGPTGSDHLAIHARLGRRQEP